MSKPTHEEVMLAASNYILAHEAWDKNLLINKFIEEAPGGWIPTREDIEAMNEVTDRMNAAQKKFNDLLTAAVEQAPPPKAEGE